MFKNILLSSLLAFGGCAHFAENHPKVAGVLSCLVADVQQQFPTLMTDVVSALSGSSPDWSALAKLEGTYGFNAVLCLVNSLISTVPAVHGALNMHVLVNAGAYLHEKGVL